MSAAAAGYPFMNPATLQAFAGTGLGSMAGQTPGIYLVLGVISFRELICTLMEMKQDGYSVKTFYDNGSSFDYCNIT